jgi:hypothetical protein
VADRARSGIAVARVQGHDAAHTTAARSYAAAAGRGVRSSMRCGSEGAGAEQPDAPPRLATREDNACRLAGAHAQL